MSTGRLLRWNGRCSAGNLGGRPAELIGFVFDPRTFRIREVRPYYAAPFRPDIARQELLDFDYAGRGYPT